MSHFFSVSPAHWITWWPTNKSWRSSKLLLFKFFLLQLFQFQILKLSSHIDPWTCVVHLLAYFQRNKILNQTFLSFSCTIIVANVLIPPLLNRRMTVNVPHRSIRPIPPQSSSNILLRIILKTVWSKLLCDAYTLTWPKHLPVVIVYISWSTISLFVHHVFFSVFLRILIWSFSTSQELV